MRVGIISDTHGRLDSRIFKIFENVDVIFHAGDVGNVDILRELEIIAPVYAVYGNVDDWLIRHQCTESVDVTFYGTQILMAHTPLQLARLRPVNDGPVVKINGHTHEPNVEFQGNVLKLNPGSVSLPRGGFKPSVALLTIGADRQPSVEIISL